MSIQTVLARLMNDGVLHVLQSEFLGEETPRVFYYTTEVSEVIEGINDASRDRQLFRRAKALFDDFIEMGEVTLALDPYNKRKTAIIAQVDSETSGMFDFRVTDPRPGLRVLGYFSEPDTFVALTYDYRENFDDAWPEKIDECKAAWRALFGDCEPFKGESNEYVTQCCTLV
jgi:hypothetical protein